MQPKTTAIRKRTQITKANKTMFVWVACASALVGFCVVGIIFLAQMLIFNEKVLSEKSQTVATLKQNNNNVSELESQVRTLDANQALMDSKANTDDRAIQVILDALPSDLNTDALGASLQQKLLTNITLESLTVNDPNTSTGSSVVAGQGEIPFSFVVSGDEAGLKKILTNLESSIRTIHITSFKIEGRDASRVLTVEAKAFYNPAVQLSLKEKVVK